MADMPPFFSSLRFKFALVLGLFSATLMFGVMFFLEQNIRESLIRENIDKGIGIARGVAFNTEDPLLTGDDIYLFSAVRNAGRSPGVVYTVITDHAGIVRAAEDLEQVGELYQPPATTFQTIETTKEYKVIRIRQEKGDLLELQVPIYSLADDPILLGGIHLGLSEALITAQVEEMRQQLIMLGVSALFVGGWLAYLLAGLFVRPVHALVEGAHAVGQGKLDVTIPLKRRDELGILTDAFNGMTESLREKEYIKNTFERYVSKPLAQQILKHKSELHLGGEEKTVTVLFSDIRGFTSLSEGLTPPELVDFLNRYYSEVVNVVGKYNGMVDKFMGDAVMVLFGAPLPLGDEEMRAASCAIEMQQVATLLSEQLGAEGKAALTIGVGIHTGRVVAGNIGSQNRMEYTVIGDNVNLASRLEGLNKLYGTRTIVSDETRAAIGDEFVFRELDYVRVKGRRKPITIYELLMEAGDRKEGFEEGLALYRQQHFEAALARFEQLVQNYDDPPAQIFAERCRNYLKTPPKKGWEGIYTASNK